MGSICLIICDNLAGTIIIGIILLFVYFLPTIIGWNTKYSSGILLLNLFLGWTIVGWIGSLIWSVSAPREEKFIKNTPITLYEYTCSKCGFKKSFEQRLKIYVCPQCNTENTVFTNTINNSKVKLTEIDSKILNLLNESQKKEVEEFLTNMKLTDLIVYHFREVKLIDAEEWKNINELGMGEDFKVIYKKKQEEK